MRILTKGSATGSARRCCYRVGASDHDFSFHTSSCKRIVQSLFYCRSVVTTTTPSSENEPPASEPKRVVRVYNGIASTPHPEQQPQPPQRQSKRMDYVRGWAWQTVLLQQRLEQKRQNRSITEDAILLLEHEPVYTLGRGADEQHVRFWNRHHHNHRTAAPEPPPPPDDEVQGDRYKLSRRARGPGTARLTVDRGQWDRILGPSTTTNSTTDGDPSVVRAMLVEQLLQSTQVSPVICPTNGAPIYRVERGGEVTYHGPGQLIVYPMLDLTASWPYYQPDLHWFLRQTEQVIMDSLTQLGLEGAHRDPAHTGVWIRDRKIAAVGVTASRWITTHGFALNVCPDLAYFDTRSILPCGIEGKGVTSLAEEGITNVSVQDVAQVVLQNIERTFRVDLSAGETIQ